MRGEKVWRLTVVLLSVAPPFTIHFRAWKGTKNEKRGKIHALVRHVILALQNQRGDHPNPRGRSFLPTAMSST